VNFNQDHQLGEMSWAGYIACMVAMIMRTEFKFETLKGKDHCGTQVKMKREYHNES